MQDFHSLTVYLGSSGRCRQVFKDSAERLGTLIGEKGHALVYGGMDAGLMGIVANGALDAGARVTGIIPKRLKDSERIHPNLSQTILVPDLWERKLKMFKRADAIVTLPGGFGTIDELLEALYWAKLGSHAKPIILVNTEHYWDEFIKYMNDLEDMPHEYLVVVPTVDDVFSALESWNYTPAVEDNIFPHFEDDILVKTDEPMIFEKLLVGEGYKLATALGLKQLGKHNRHIGLLNEGGRFDDLLRWVDLAQKETFITDHCTALYSVADTRDALNRLLTTQKKITIDLALEKWGPSETKTHIELHETE